MAIRPRRLGGAAAPHGECHEAEHGHDEAAKRDAVKIADHVRYGAATPPLVFPAQLTRLPSRWRVGSVYYVPDARMLRASRFALSTGTPNLGADGGLEYQTDLPYFSDIDPATSHKTSAERRAPRSSTVTEWS